MQSPPATCKALEPLFDRFQRADAPGIVVGIARHGRVIHRAAYGMASVQHGVANSPVTRMRIGSTSKHFACLAALLLQEQGKLDLDAPLSRYVEEFDTPNNYGDMPTLRHLMRHTSGRNCALELAIMANGYAYMPRGYLIGAMSRQRARAFAPGEGQLYNNGGYHVLSVAIERATECPFGDVLREQVFEPLGMVDTECVPDFLTLVPRMATLHVPDADGGWRLGRMSVEDLLGEGSIVSTVDDMLRWLAHLNGPKSVGTEASWREMFDTAPLASGQTSTYAMGLFRHSYRGLEVIHHSGTVIGGSSQMMTVPSAGIDVVIMSNGAPVSTQQLTRDALDVLLADEFTERGDPLVKAADYSHLAGALYHSAESGLSLAFNALPDGTLGLGLWHMPALPILREREDGTLSARFEDIAAGPVELRAADLAADAAGGAPQTLSVRQMGRLETLQKLPSTPPDAEDVAQGLTGRFHCSDLAADARIHLGPTGLTLEIRGEYSGWQSHPLRPLTRDVLAVDGGPGVTLRRGEDGQVRRMRLDGLRARSLELVRVEQT